MASDITLFFVMMASAGIISLPVILVFLGELD